MPLPEGKGTGNAGEGKESEGKERRGKEADYLSLDGRATGSSKPLLCSTEDILSGIFSLSLYNIILSFFQLFLFFYSRSTNM